MLNFFKKYLRFIIINITILGILFLFQNAITVSPDGAIIQTAIYQDLYPKSFSLFDGQSSSVVLNPSALLAIHKSMELGSSTVCIGVNCNLAATPVTSCVQYNFETFVSVNSPALVVRYAHVPKVGTAFCAGAYCGSSPGLVLLGRDAINQSWLRLGYAENSGELNNPNLSESKILTLNKLYSQIAICRAGGGSSRDHLKVSSLVQRYVQKSTNLVPDKNQCVAQVPSKVDSLRWKVLTDFTPKYKNLILDVTTYPFNSLAYQCLYKLNAAQKLNMGCEINEAERIGQALLAQSDLDGDGKMGWGLRSILKNDKCGVGGYDAFSDGTCNQTNTPYMFQTGLVLDCLGKLYEVTGNPDYLKAVKKGIADSMSFGSGQLGTCEDCFEYSYSYSPNDVGRFVRNTSLEMAVPLAFLYKHTGALKYRDRLFQVLKSEQFNYNNGNKGYLSIYDPKFSSTEKWRNEDHMPSHVRYLSRVSQELKINNLNLLSDNLQKDWRFCSGNPWCAKQRAQQDPTNPYQSGNIDMFTNTYTALSCSAYGMSSQLQNDCIHEMNDFYLQKKTPTSDMLTFILESL